MTVGSVPAYSKHDYLWRRRITLGSIAMSLESILVVVLLLALIGALPSWPHSRSWGYGPSSGMGLLIVILVVLLLLGKI